MAKHATGVGLALAAAAGTWVLAEPPPAPMLPPLTAPATVIPRAEAPNALAAPKDWRTDDAVRPAAFAAPADAKDGARPATPPSPRTLPEQVRSAAPLANGDDIRPPGRAFGAGTAAPLVVANAVVKYLHEARVPAEVPGVIASLGVKVGDAVRAGQPLAALKDDFAKLDRDLKAKAAENKAPMQIAELDESSKKALYESGKSLRQGGNLSLELFQERQTEYQAATLRRINEISKAGQADLDAAKAAATLAQHTIVSPLSGVALAVEKKLGESVQGLETVVHVVNLDQVKLEARLNAGLRDRVRVGQAVEAMPNRVAEPDFVFTYPAELHAVRLLPGNRLLAAAADDGAVVFWNLGDGRAERLAPVSAAPLRALACSPKEPRRLIAGGDDGSLRFIDVRTGSELRSALALVGAARISAIACSPTNPDLGHVGREDGSIVRVNWRTGVVDAELKPETGGRTQAHANEVASLAYSQDGKWLLSVAGDEIGAWNVATGKAAMYRGRRGAAAKDMRLANFAPDGASFPFNQGTTLHLRRASDGLPLAELAGEVAFARFALHLPEPGMLLAGGDDDALHLWRWTNDGRPPRHARTLRGAGTAQHGDVADDGALCAACGDRGVRVWRLPNAATLDAERLPGRVAFVSPQLQNDFAELHVEVDNRGRHLDVNGTATIVIGTDR